MPGVLGKAGGGCCSPRPLLTDELQRELWLAFSRSEMHSQGADSRGKDECVVP